MNYRHAYHAGNFADVLKHAVLALVIAHLKRKEAPFRLIDTHAGAGIYDLAGNEAGKTGEWRDGIGRLLGPDAPSLPGEIAAILEPYLAAVRQHNPAGALTTYPGSPRIALSLMRPQDRLIANELHEEDSAVLARELRGDRRAKVLQLDGWIALKSLLPPRERRGLILIDPAFEERDEFERLARGIREAARRFATGVYVLWHPIKDTAKVDGLRDTIASLFPRTLAAELFVRALRDAAPLSGSGLLVCNAPHTLHAELDVLLPFLVSRLAQGRGAFASVKSL